MNVRQLKRDASDAVDRSSGAKQVSAVYAGVVVAASAVLTLVNFFLDTRIAQTGGLSNIGLRSVLSTVQSILPLAQSVVMLCLELGFLNAMLRVVRNQYVSPNSLRLGFDRFWPLMRLTLLESMIYMGIGLLATYLSTQLFVLLPISDKAMIIAAEMVSSGNVMVDEAVMYELLWAMWPMLPIFAVIYLVMMLPMFYRLRMAPYVLIDKPRAGALAAMGESRRMMKGNCLKLAKLDLSLWWYHLLTVLAMVVAYGDVILPLVGITLPWSATVSYFVFYFTFLAMQFAIFWFFLSKVTAAYALSYEAMRPKSAPTQGVVLGNIFDLAREQ